MSPPTMLDSHLHLWDLAVRDQAWIPPGSPIRRSFDVRDLRSALAGTPVDGVILVQVINDADETTDFIDCARKVDIVRGVVGWADLTSPGFSAALSALTSTGRLVGIRHQALAEADPAGWLRSPGAGKLSGLQTIASPDWTYPELAPYIDIALEAFGPSRLIFGSDWPVSSQAAPYSRVCEVAQAACSALSGGERAAVLAGNARAIYLDGRRTSEH